MAAPNLDPIPSAFVFGDFEHYTQSLPGSSGLHLGLSLVNIQSNSSVSAQVHQLPVVHDTTAFTQYLSST